MAAPAPPGRAGPGRAGHSTAQHSRPRHDPFPQRRLFPQAVHDAILRHRFLIVRAKELRCGAEQSRRFYREHAGRFFYQRLVEFMASGPMWAYILAHEDAVPLWRSLMGPTKVFRARHSDPDSIRGAYGLTDTRNTTHGSDSPASASREIAFFFPEFDEQRWYEQDEPRLRRGQLFYSAQERVHRVLGARPAQVPGQGVPGWPGSPCGRPPGQQTQSCAAFQGVWERESSVVLPGIRLLV
ncbi:nucleoside diphosphate kinase 6 [Onychostruthus taczanowskii]|uniref:nucleoside diphosphate kinase 6 n=1 Tax=Onychostruthus taczanowskii TaxID=356909 RepID=UPI001B80813A|nr:nucleoside diphosphate kinase 6 [Onychostruthus taczanowskii]